MSTGAAHMLGYSDLLSRSNKEMNMMWEPIIKKVGLKKKIAIWAKLKKFVQNSIKLYFIVW